MTLGQRIKEQREALGFTQYKVAMEIGVHPGVVQRYETDKCSPRVEYLEALARVLGTSPNELLGWPDSEAQLAAR